MEIILKNEGNIFSWMKWKLFYCKIHLIYWMPIIGMDKIFNRIEETEDMKTNVLECLYIYYNNKYINTTPNWFSFHTFIHNNNGCCFFLE